MTLDNKPSNSLPVSLSPRHPVNLNKQIKYLTAYPYSDYGILNEAITVISADAITPQNNNL
ncbi:MAG: hypothetical protein ACRC2S_05605 [Waterburya sp.]